MMPINKEIYIASYETNSLIYSKMHTDIHADGLISKGEILRFLAPSSKFNHENFQIFHFTNSKEFTLDF